MVAAFDRAILDGTVTCHNILGNSSRLEIAQRLRGCDRNDVTQCPVCFGHAERACHGQKKLAVTMLYAVEDHTETVSARRVPAAKELVTLLVKVSIAHTALF